MYRASAASENMKSMEISETIRVRVRFSEVDPIRMVWHGNYVKYLEDAREAFGRRWGLGYQLIFISGYFAPVYDMHLRYLMTATVDDELDVTIKWMPEKGAKICFKYDITRVRDGLPVLKAETVQLFTTHAGDLETSEPEFYRKWKEGVLKKLTTDSK